MSTIRPSELSPDQRASEVARLSRLLPPGPPEEGEHASVRRIRATVAVLRAVDAPLGTEQDVIGLLRDYTARRAREPRRIAQADGHP